MKAALRCSQLSCGNPIASGGSVALGNSLSACILNFILVDRRKPISKVMPLRPLQGAQRRRTRERSPLAGLVALRSEARSVFAHCPKLEPLPEHFGLQPKRLVSLQV
jgi:hypothetical protein